MSNGAEWIYNSSPEISALTLNKNGIVNLRDDDIDKKCKSNCKFHTILHDSLLKLILTKMIHLNSRIELLTKRTIREKLLTYFCIHE